LALTISMVSYVSDEDIPVNFIADTSVGFDTEDRSIDGFEERVRSVLEELKIDFLSEETDKEFDDYALARIITIYRLYQVDAEQLFDNLISLLFQAMFVLVPFFAMVLKLFYLRSGRFYTEHLIFSIHNHTFIYLIFILGSFFDLLELVPYMSYVAGILTAITVIWIPVYLFLALKRFYQQGTLITIVKYVLLIIIYNILLLSVVSITTLGFILI